MNTKQDTINTYNEHATELAEKFDRLGVRVEDIQEVFALLPKENLSVLEIGCGNGRDAGEILKYTKHYIGMDVSGGLITLAKQKVPDGRFEVADIESYALPSDLDIVFAFASLLRVNKESFKYILENLFSSLNPGGLVRISLKQADSYQEKIQTDQFGTRLFYLYSPRDIEELSQRFVILKNEVLPKGEQSWLEVLLQKSSS